MAEINLNVNRENSSMEGSAVDVGDITGGDHVSVNLRDADEPMSNHDRRALEELKSEVRELVKVVSALVVAVRGNAEFNLTGLMQRTMSLETRMQIVTILLIVLCIYLAFRAAS